MKNMRTTARSIDSPVNFANPAESRRARVVVADGSDDYLAAVMGLLEFHDVIDLIGRASNFEETIQLVVNHQPELVLIDLEMPLSSLAIPAIILCSRSSPKVVGMCDEEMCDGEAAPLQPLDVIASVNALIHKSRLRQDFLPLIDELFGGAVALGPVFAPPELDANNNQPRPSVQLSRTAH
jgi:DNA-binding NarL/FixJ family response regulator